ncbi:hypothetical protein BDW_07625 [Bdellovibrio bacteriovorus W]|nr:hypothetical protein BDW_07625 [Bdellovibrio bacteriovorus W]
MKTSVALKHFIVSACVLGAVSVSEAAVSYIKGKYAVDPAHSRISFVIPHFVVSEVEGRFNEVEGVFTLAEPFTKSTVSAKVPVSSIDTGVKQRDDHLKSKDFFEVTKFPDMRLVSKSITGTPEAFKLTAALTIKGVTKDVVFEGKFTGNVKDPMGQERAALQMTGMVNRKDFNIAYNDQIAIGPAVGDDVKIRIWTEGLLETGKAPSKK